VIKSRILIRARYVACMGERRDQYGILVGKPEGRRPLEDPGIGGRIILKWMLREVGLGVWTGSI
jgi:hypothetical protein